MTEKTTPAGDERPPEEAIQSEPTPVPAGRPQPDLCHPEPHGQEAVRGLAGRDTSWLGWASLILGVVAVCSIGCGVSLRLSPRLRGPYIAMSAAVCVSPVLTLPGLALGVASLAQKNRSRSAGVVGCWINGLILAVWLMLFAAASLTSRRQWVPRDPPEVPRDGSDFFRRP